MITFVGGSKFAASGFGPGGPYPLADLDRGDQIKGGPNPPGHRQLLQTIRVIKAQSCKTTDARINKNDDMFSNAYRKIQRGQQLASKVIQMYTQSNSTEKSFHVSSSSPQNQTSRFKIANIIGEEKIATTSNILSCTNVVQLSKAIVSCVQKPRFLL